MQLAKKVGHVTLVWCVVVWRHVALKSITVSPRADCRPGPLGLAVAPLSTLASAAPSMLTTGQGYATLECHVHPRTGMIFPTLNWFETRMPYNAVHDY
jgi:hypothetical protein